MLVGRGVVGRVRLIGHVGELLWRRERNRMLGSSAHVIVKRVHVGRGDCPLGGLIDDGVDGTGY